MINSLSKFFLNEIEELPNKEVLKIFLIKPYDYPSFLYFGDD